LRRTIRDLAAERVREMCVVPIAFVSDHVETLAEIDHEAREQAAALGIRQFEMTSGLNDSPTFIAALADLVKDALDMELSHAGESHRLVAAD
jgi:ferrochelatase